MSEPDQQGTSSDRRIYIGLAAGLAIGVALNLASYFFWVTPDLGKLRIPKSHQMGFPKIFWVENPRGTAAPRNPTTHQVLPFQPAFYWGAFLGDALATLAIGAAVAQWYEKRGKTVETPNEQSTSTETPK